jgi:hypothetical protein
MQTLVDILPLCLPMKSSIDPLRSVVGTYSKLLACLAVSLTVTHQQTTRADPTFTGGRAGKDYTSFWPPM